MIDPKDEKLSKEDAARQELDRIRETFVANVSHELRTPLTVLQGYLEELIFLKNASPDHWPENAPWGQWCKIFDRMEQQTNRMQQLVSDLLLLASIESADLNKAELEHININILLDSLIADAKSISDNKHEFIVDIKSDIGLIGKKNEITSAFSNLLVNAVRYTPEGGKIFVNWYEDEAKGIKYFEVKDTGIGIAKKDLKRITKRFYRVDKGRSRDRGGTGLGLSIVKHVLIRHKAKLVVKSEEGKGSLFQCEFKNKQEMAPRDGLEPPTQ